MINVNQITAELARMPDQALQQYAAMHKSDPYTVSLALAEANRRKEMRGAAHMQQGQQPKVVDQELAGMAAPQHMLPEEQGIGQLPAENIKGMAGGGIVAFEEGGEVPRFVNDGLVYAPYSYGNTGNTQQFTPEQLAEAKRLREMGMFDLLKEKFGPAWQALTTGPSQQITKQETLQSGTDLGGPGSSPANTGAPVTGQTINFQNQQGQQGVGQQGVGQTQPAPTAGGIAGGYEKKFLDLLGKGEVSKEDRIKEMTEINKPVLEKMTSLIDENKSKLKTEGEQNFYMSLIQGGLAAAGASGPNALQNLAQGFEKGAAHYGEGLKDLRKAAQENSKMELSKTEYEATGKKDALKSFYDHQDKMLGFKAQGLASIMGHEISANATAAHAGAQERLISRIGSDPKFAESYSKYLTAGADAKSLPTIAAGYAKDPMKLEMLKQTDPTLYNSVKAYLNQQTVPGVVNAPTGNVRP